MIEFCKVNNNFEIKQGDNSFEFKSVLDFSECRLEISKYAIFLFYNKHISENNIMQVFHNNVLNNSEKKRIGWIFSIQSLFSKEHKFSDNIHFLQYALNSLYLFLDLLVKNNFKDLENNLENNDVEIDNLCIFCLSNETINNFNINHYIASFYNYNFFYISDFKYLYGLDFKISNTNINFNEHDKIKISPISKLFQKNETFINILFLEIFPFNHNYLLEFMYCYQIIEFSIDELQKKKHESLLKEIKKYDKEPRKINEIVRSISLMLKEDTRISKINEIITGRINLINLKDSCNRLLAKYNREEGNNLNEYLYGVRNLLIHEFRIIKNLNELEEIVLYFKEFIVQLISIYDESEDDRNIKQNTLKIKSKRKNKKYLKKFK